MKKRRAGNRRKTARPATSNADDDTAIIKSEARLLERIQRDTGERGQERGDYIVFDRCPICGHEGGFRYYPRSNSFTCFCSGHGDRRKGSAIDYLLGTGEASDVAEAFSILREETGHPRKVPAKRRAADVQQPVNGQHPDGYMLPRWEHVRAVDPPKRRPVLVDGILRRGHVGVIVGKGKAGKSCAVMELSIAVATGGEWLGRRVENGGDVLFIDPEIDPASAHGRFARLCEAMGADKATVDRRVLKWSLRGTTATIGQVVADIRRGVERGDLRGLALVVVDSASIFVEGDENSSVDVRRLFSGFNQIAAATGAAVVAVAHTGKALDGDRSAADRARGSSVWLDAPDALISISETFPPSGEARDVLGEGRSGCIVEAGGLREFPQFEPVRCVFDYPLHRVDTDGLTEGWKPNSSARRGGKSTGGGNRAKSATRAVQCEAALLAEFVARGSYGGIPAKEAAELCSAAVGETVKPSTLKGYVQSSELLDAEQVSPQRWQVVPSRTPQTAMDLDGS